MKPRYSGPKSEKFWTKVNSLPKSKQRAIYAAGVLLQELEGRVLEWLNSALKEEGRR